MAETRRERIWLEPFRGGYMDPKFIGLSGEERALLWDPEKATPPPVAHLIGMRPASFGGGESSFTMPASGFLMSSQGHIAGGALAILADGPLGSAVATALEAGTFFTTAEISMTFLRPVVGDGGLITARGRLIHIDPPLALSECFLEDSTGRLVAHGTSICFVFPPMEGIEKPDDLTLPERPVYDTPDPYERPYSGEVIPWDTWKELDGLTLLKMQIAEELPAPPIHYLTGLTLVDASEGRATFELPATEWLCNPGRTIQGGAVAMVAHSALASSVITTVDAGAAYAPVDLKVNLLRPVNPTGEPMVAEGQVVHRGRTLAVATSEVKGPDGKTVATATGSTRITPERLSGSEAP